MFNRDSNLQLGEKIIKLNYPKLTKIRVIEHNANLFFNDVYKIPILQ